jgi:protein-S-isoprenylcysteine O-methyltransferase Ste14
LYHVGFLASSATSSHFTVPLKSLAYSVIDDLIYLFLLLFSYEVLLTLDREKHRFYGPIYYYVFNCLLFSLLVLHIYWWVLIWRMLVKQIQSKGRVGDDVRSGQ